MSKRQRTPYIQMINVQDYVHNMSIRSRTTFRIKEDGSMFYVVDGEEIPKYIFEQQHPVTPIPPKGMNNVDKRNLWLHDGKSY